MKIYKRTVLKYIAMQLSLKLEFDFSIIYQSIKKLYLLSQQKV